LGETDLQWIKSRRVWAVLGLVLLVQGAAIAFVLARERAAREADRAQMTFNHNPDALWRPSSAKPIVRPQVTRPEAARLNPAEAVIGVEVDGKARAYRLLALESQYSHLVNDMIGTVPVSVAYCNLSGCVSVFTDPAGSAPLDVKVAGILNLEMVLQINGNLYYQKSGSPADPAKASPAMPLQVLAPIRTNWGEWRRLHPETDLYIGDPSLGDRSTPDVGGRPVSPRAPKG
jgi:hypothetical protein